jgi:hypothetical protein
MEVSSSRHLPFLEFEAAFHSSTLPVPTLGENLSAGDGRDRLVFAMDVI